MVHSHEVSGLPLKTGDLLCTTDGNERLAFSLLYEALGALVPGPVDHIAIYIGPGPRCVEAGAMGVVTFDLPGAEWDSAKMWGQRLIADTLYGVAYPLAGRGLAAEEEEQIRAGVARYCLEQAAARKPYNVNFLNSATEDAFYCSQLVYLAYKRHGIDLNSGVGVFDHPIARSVIFPWEIWNACAQRERAALG